MAARDEVNREVMRTANRLRKEGRGVEMLELLRDGLRRGLLSVESAERAGAMVQNELLLSAEHSPLLRVMLLGQASSPWLKNAIVSAAWSDGLSAIVSDGAYDNVLQDVSALPRFAVDDAPVLVLLPWSQRLLGGDDRSIAARVRDEVDFWRDVWRIAGEKGIARIIQIGYDWVLPGAAGYHLAGMAGGDIHLVRTVNDALRSGLPSGAFFVPLDEISGGIGRVGFYDARRYFWTKQPFSEAGIGALAKHVAAALRAVTVGPRKVLVVDLDNTLWGGIVGEVGVNGIALGETAEGEAFVAFQRYLRALTHRGTLLVACSKNNWDDAREPFLSDSRMALSLDEFAAFEANWDPKVDNLRRIAKSLNLGLESFVFFDDSKAEQEYVRQALSEVLVVDVPDDPADYVRALQATLCFETVAVTPDDTERARRYATEMRRREAGKSAGSLDEYLRSLDMVADIRAVEDADLTRVVQLLGKTNQFNLTSRRHGVEQVRELLSRQGAVGFTLRLRDRFGDHGLVAVVLAAPAVGRVNGPPAMLVDTLLMSCRVIGRSVEQLLLGRLITEARRLGFSSLIGEFIPTPRNGLVKEFYTSQGFSRLATVDAPVPSATRYELTLATAAIPATFVRLEE